MGRFIKEIELTKRSKYINHSPVIWHWAFSILCIIALILSSLSSWHFLTGSSMAGCGEGSACENVLNSKWSAIANTLPVSGLAMGVYLTILFASLFIGPSTEIPIRLLAWKTLLVLAGSIVGSAIWFTIVQKFFIGKFCLYCMATHLTGLSIAALVFWRVVKEQIWILFYYEDDNEDYSKPGVKTRTKYNTVVVLALIGVGLACILAVCQIVFTSNKVSKGESLENIAFEDYKNAPLIGSPNSSYMVTVLFDYQCIHCQKIHLMLERVVKKYNGKLAFVLCPTPLSPQCNPYVHKEMETFKNSCELARIGLAVWLAKPKEFSTFENWMFTYEFGDKWSPRTPEDARLKAIELVGDSIFTEKMSNPWIEQYLQSCTQIFGKAMQNGKGGIPKFIYKSRWVIPQPNNADDLITILQKNIALPEP